jgi:TPR repeat protein
MGDLLRQIKSVFAVSLGKGLAQTRGLSPELIARANAGDASSQRLVGFAYMRGEGVRQNHTQAAYWYGKAAEQGDAIGQEITQRGPR